MSKKFDQKLQQ